MFIIKDEYISFFYKPAKFLFAIEEEGYQIDIITETREHHIKRMFKAYKKI